MPTLVVGMSEADEIVALTVLASMATAGVAMARDENRNSFLRDLRG